MKILHFADVHARNKNLTEIEKCLNFMIETAKEEKPDVIINAGDTFDSQNIQLDSPAVKMIFRVFAELANIAPIAIIIGTPSHDGKAAELLSHIKAKHNIWVATAPEQIYLQETAWDYRLTKDDLPVATRAVISMIPAPTKQFFKTDSGIKGSDNEIAQAMSTMFAGFGAQAAQHDCPHVLVGHWNVTGALISETQTLTGRDVEISKEQMALANADLVALGHIHMHQQIGENIFFSGSTQSNTWGEMSTPGFYIYEINDADLSSRFIPTPSKKRIRINNDFTKTDIAKTEIPITEDMKGAVVRHDIKVFQDEVIKLNIEQIKQKFIGAGCEDVEVNIIRVPRENTRSKAILTLDRLRDKLIERAALNDGEIIPESILIKADQLESEPGEQILSGLI